MRNSQTPLSKPCHFSRSVLSNSKPICALPLSGRMCSLFVFCPKVAEFAAIGGLFRRRTWNFGLSNSALTCLDAA